MSLGFAGRGILSAQDENVILYTYSCSDINLGNYRQEIEDMNGIIQINRSAFVAPTIRQKIKRMPDGKKKRITFRIIKPVDEYALILSEAVQIDNCSSCWRKIQGVDFIALRLLSKIIKKYHQTGEIPETVTYFV